MISLGFLIFAILFVLSIMLGGLDKLPVFWDFNSFVLVSLGIAGYTLLFGRKEFVRGMKVFFAFSFPQDDDATKAGRFFLRLAEFILSWGLFVMIFGLVMMLADLDPDKVGIGVAVCILGFLYAMSIALFVFLPIGLRLSPSTLPMSGLWRFSIRQWLIAFFSFFLIRCLFVVIFIILQAPERTGPITSQEFGTVVSRAAFMFNPADPQGDVLPSVADVGMPLYFLQMLCCFWDLPCLVLVVGGWWAFRLASGKRRKMIAAPVVILIGLTGTILGCVLMLSDLDPELLGCGFLVSMISTLYGFIGAVGFLISDMRSNPGTNVPDSCAVSPTLSESEDMEQAKQIIDRAVEDVQNRSVR